MWQNQRLFVGSTEGMFRLPDPPASSTRPKEEGRLRFWPERFRSAWGKPLASSAFALINGAVTTAVLALLAHWTDSPLVFPSLGPTAFLLFHRPLSNAACPRNALAGHLLAILVGWLSLALMGLTDAPPILEVGVTPPRIVAAALSIGLTSGLMVLLNVPHPPAGATTLIVSLGLIHEPAKYPLLMLGVALLILQGFIINRLAGLPYPLWAPVDAATKARHPSFS